jgi:protein ImuB
LAALAGEQQVLVPAAAGGRQPGSMFRWTPAVTADLDRPDQRLALAAGPWPGQLPAPSPALVPAEPDEVEVRDVAGFPVRVTGRGVVTASPASMRWLRRDRSVAVQAWAGPWPIDEQWWDPARARRLARFQMLGDDGVLRLVTAERQRWWVQAIYG